MSSIRIHIACLFAHIAGLFAHIAAIQAIVSAIQAIVSAIQAIFASIHAIVSAIQAIVACFAGLFAHIAAIQAIFASIHAIVANRLEFAHGPPSPRIEQLLESLRVPSRRPLLVHQVHRERDPPLLCQGLGLAPDQAAQAAH
jgi:hypothetical protein